MLSFQPSKDNEEIKSETRLKDHPTSLPPLNQGKVTISMRDTDHNSLSHTKYGVFSESIPVSSRYKPHSNK